MSAKFKMGQKVKSNVAGEAEVYRGPVIQVHNTGTLDGEIPDLWVYRIRTQHGDDWRYYEYELEADDA